MCKAKQEIHMLRQLWPVIDAQKKVSTQKIQNAMRTSGKTPRFFMYIANWCGNSKRAFNHIQNTILKDIKTKSDYFTVVNTVKKKRHSGRHTRKPAAGSVKAEVEQSLQDWKPIFCLSGCSKKWDRLLHLKQIKTETQL